MRAFVSRIVAGPVAALVAWLVGMGLELGAGFSTALTEAATLFGVAVVTALYGVVHRLIDRRGVNPADAAAPDAVAEGQAAIQRARRTL